MTGGGCGRFAGLAVGWRARLGSGERERERPVGNAVDDTWWTADVDLRLLVASFASVPSYDDTVSIDVYSTDDASMVEDWMVEDSIGEDSTDNDLVL